MPSQSVPCIGNRPREYALRSNYDTTRRSHFEAVVADVVVADEAGKADYPDVGDVAAQDYLCFIGRAPLLRRECYVRP